MGVPSPCHHYAQLVATNAGKVVHVDVAANQGFDFQLAMLERELHDRLVHVVRSKDEEGLLRQFASFV